MIMNIIPYSINTTNMMNCISWFSNEFFISELHPPEAFVKGLVDESDLEKKWDLGQEKKEPCSELYRSFLVSASPPVQFLGSSFFYAHQSVNFWPQIRVPTLLCSLSKGRGQLFWSPALSLELLFLLP